MSKELCVEYDGGFYTQEAPWGIAKGVLPCKYVFPSRQLYLLYLNLYDSWFSEMPAENIKKIEDFYSQQVKQCSNGPPPCML